jgi:hypothetical protein
MFRGLINRAETTLDSTSWAPVFLHFPGMLVPWVERLANIRVVLKSNLTFALFFVKTRAEKAIVRPLNHVVQVTVGASENARMGKPVKKHRNPPNLTMAGVPANVNGTPSTTSSSSPPGKQVNNTQVEMEKRLPPHRLIVSGGSVRPARNLYPTIAEPSYN